MKNNISNFNIHVNKDQSGHIGVFIPKKLSKPAKALAALFYRMAINNSIVVVGQGFDEETGPYLTQGVDFGNVQLSAQFLEQEFGTYYYKLIEELEAANFIFAKQGFKQGKCNIYQLNELMTSILFPYPGAVQKLTTALNPDKTFKYENQLWDDARNVYPKIITDALAVLKSRPYNLDLIKAVKAQVLLSPRNQKEAEEKIRIEKLISGIGLQTTEDRVYQHCYKPCSTGRIFETGVMLLQGAPSDVQKASLYGFEYKNFDLKSCQPRILVALGKELGLEAHTKWLEDYIKWGSVDKAAFTRRTFGVYKPELEKVCKDSVISLIFGAGVKLYKEKDKLCTIAKSFKDTGLNNWEASHKRFLEETKPLSDLIKEVNNNLSSIEKEKKEVINHFFSYRYNKGARKWVFTNACGLKFNKKDEAQLLAFLLQGTEAAFIHTLTALSTKYDFVVYENMHDGLITDKEIPSEAVEEAKQLVGLDCFDLVEKPL